MNSKFDNKDYSEGYKDAITGFLGLPEYDYEVTIRPVFEDDRCIELIISKYENRVSMIIEKEMLKRAEPIDIVNYCLINNIKRLTVYKWEKRFSISD